MIISARYASKDVKRTNGEYFMKIDAKISSEALVFTDPVWGKVLEHTVSWKMARGLRASETLRAPLAEAYTLEEHPSWTGLRVEA